MALASWQSHTFWIQTDCSDPISDEVQNYWNFFYATNEAHLTNMIISLDCLYESKKPKLNNFETLFSLIKDNIDPKLLNQFNERLTKLQKLSKSIKVIRNNSFAHVAHAEVRNSIGDKYSLPREDYLRLSYHAIKLATEIGLLLGEEVMEDTPEAIADKDLNDISKIYESLQQNTIKMANKSQ